MPNWVKSRAFQLFLAVVVGVFITAVIYYFIGRPAAVGKVVRSSTSTSTVCLSEECIHASSNLHHSLNTAVDPCDDFYTFTCGGWVNNTPNYDWTPQYGVLESIQSKLNIAILNFLESKSKLTDVAPIHKARHFYQSCLKQVIVDRADFKLIREYLVDVGLDDLPSIFLTNDTNVVKFDWVMTAANIRKTLGMNVFLPFEIDMDFFNTKRRIPYVGVAPTQAAKLNWDEWMNIKSFDKVYEEPLSESSSMNAISDIRAVMTLYLDDFTTGLNNATLQETAELLQEMEVGLEMLKRRHLNNLQATYLIKPYKKYKASQLQSHLEQCLKRYGETADDVWEPFLLQLFDGMHGGFDVTQDYIYTRVEDLDYLCSLYAFQKKRYTSKGWELFYWWKVVERLMYYANKDQEIDVAIFLQQSKREISLQCAEMTNNYMNKVISYGLSNHTFARTTKRKATTMVNNIKDAFAQRISMSKWIDQPTRTAMLAKLSGMKQYIGYPDWMYDRVTINDYYEDIEITPDAYLANVMLLIETSIRNRFSTYKQDFSDRSVIKSNTANAYYDPLHNAIYIPLSILTFPMYNLGLEVLNYGAIGSIIGHELTHGFDDTGRLFDKDGNFVPLWTYKSMLEFNRQAQCFIDQYDGFFSDDVQLKLNGTNSLDENIADNGGLEQAYLAYQKYKNKNGNEMALPGFESYTAEQMFFISFGSLWCQANYPKYSELAKIVMFIIDEHSPNNFRVIGSLQNSEKFANAFHCPIGSKMNPKRERCQIW